MHFIGDCKLHSLPIDFTQNSGLHTGIKMAVVVKTSLTEMKFSARPCRLPSNIRKTTERSLRNYWITRMWIFPESWLSVPCTSPKKLEALNKIEFIKLNIADIYDTAQATRYSRLKMNQLEDTAKQTKMKTARVPNQVFRSYSRQKRAGILLNTCWTGPSSCASP